MAVLFSVTQDQLPSDTRGHTSDVQAKRVSKGTEDAGDDDSHSDGDPEFEVHSATGTGPEVRTRAHSKEDADRREREGKRTIKEHGTSDTERNARDFDSKEHQLDRDPRKSLMPNVLHRTLFEDSFGMGAIDSQVIKNDCHPVAIRYSVALTEGYHS